MDLLNALFEILKKETHYYVIKLAHKEHDIFKAHFPNNEILPGFIQIDIISSLMNHKIISIKKAKFISLVKPNDIISFDVSTKDNIKYKVIIKKDEKKVSEIIYEI